MPSKDKEKGKKEAKTSNGKGRKGITKTEPKGEPIETGIQTEWHDVCLFCARHFSQPAAIQSHLLTSNHCVPTAPITQVCRVCREKTNITELENHVCSINKLAFLDQYLSSTAIKKGTPTVCLICRGRPMESKIALIVHLICIHAPNKPKGRCSQCSFEYHEPDNISNLEEAWMDPVVDEHVSREHEHGFGLVISQRMLDETALRFPYTCPLCEHSMSNNVDFQAHVICRHATRDGPAEQLHTCLECNLPKYKSDILNRHISNEHTRSLRILADRWSREGLIQDFIDFSHMCTTCWHHFDYDFALQAHIITVHTSNDVRVCGWCKEIVHRPKMTSMLTWKAIKRHEQKHARMTHAIALEFKMTEIPIPDEALVDEFDEVKPVERPISPKKREGKGKTVKKRQR